VPVHRTTGTYSASTRVGGWTKASSACLRTSERLSRGLPRVVSIAISWTQWFNLWWKLLRTQSHQIIETVKLAAATPSGQKARRTSLEPPKTSRSYCSGCRFLAQDGACSVYRSCVANVTMTICNSCKLGVFRLESVRHTGLPGLAPCLASR